MWKEVNNSYTKYLEKAEAENIQIPEATKEDVNKLITASNQALKAAQDVLKGLNLRGVLSRSSAASASSASASSVKATPNDEDDRHIINHLSRRVFSNLRTPGQSPEELNRAEDNAVAIYLEKSSNILQSRMSSVWSYLTHENTPLPDSLGRAYEELEENAVSFLKNKCADSKKKAEEAAHNYDNWKKRVRGYSIKALSWIVNVIHAHPKEAAVLRDASEAYLGIQHPVAVAVVRVAMTPSGLAGRIEEYTEKQSVFNRPIIGPFVKDTIVSKVKNAENAVRDKCASLYDKHITKELANLDKENQLLFIKKRRAEKLMAADDEILSTFQNINKIIKTRVEAFQKEKAQEFRGKLLTASDKFDELCITAGRLYKLKYEPALDEGDANVGGSFILEPRPIQQTSTSLSDRVEFWRGGKKSCETVINCLRKLGQLEGNIVQG